MRLGNHAYIENVANEKERCPYYLQGKQENKCKHCVLSRSACFVQYNSITIMLALECE